MKKCVLLLLCLLLIPVAIPGKGIEVKVLGLVCNACGIGIKKHLIKTKKVEKIKLDVEKHIAYIYLFKDHHLTDKEINKAIDNAGYEVSKITRSNEK
jgi:copper chaperone CopZ